MFSRQLIEKGLATGDELAPKGSVPRKQFMHNYLAFGVACFLGAGFAVAGLAAAGLGAGFAVAGLAAAGLGAGFAVAGLAAAGLAAAGFGAAGLAAAGLAAAGLDGAFLVALDCGMLETNVALGCCGEAFFAARAAAVFALALVVARLPVVLAGAFLTTFSLGALPVSGRPGSSSGSWGTFCARKMAASSL